ncbi:unnamed protein product, partial [Discosporangium mesarthrocarpum]
RITSVHRVEWCTEERARDEVLVRVRGQPRVVINEVFTVSLLVRNLSSSARDLVVMFTMDSSEAARAPIYIHGTDTNDIEDNDDHDDEDENDDEGAGNEGKGDGD